MKLSIVIPCYNEGKNIPLIVDGYAALVRGREVEVIIVDNGSSDGTAAALQELLPNHPFLKVVRVEVNQGYGFGIIAGLRRASGEYIGWTHGDMQTPPSDVFKALDIVSSHEGRKDIYIKGRRQGRPLFDSFFTRGMDVFETVYLGKVLNDINAQPNVFHRSFFESWQNPPHDFSLDLYAFYKGRKEGLEIIRFKVDFLKRIHGESHWNKSLASKWKFIKRTVDFSLRLKKNNL